MYSGYILFYGLNLTQENLLKALSRYLSSEQMAILENIPEAKRFDLVRKANQQLREAGSSLSIDMKRCCYFDDTFYFGVDCGSTDFVYRDEVDTYQNFVDYHATMLEQLEKLKKNWEDHREQAIEELKKCETLEGIEGGPKFYKYANDCENCT